MLQPNNGVIIFNGVTMANNSVSATLPEQIQNVQGTTATLQLSVPASQPIGLLPNSDVAFYPFGLAVSAVNVVPSTEVWRLINMVVYSALTPDIMVGLVVNGQNQPLSVDLNTVVIQGNSSRINAINPYMDLPANSTFNFTAYLTAANGSTAQTINVSVVMQRIPLAVYLASTGSSTGRLFNL